MRRTQRNRFALEIPRLGSFIASGNWTAREIGLDTFPVEDRPPVLIPFFGFRIMVGMGLIMLGVSWLGNLLRWRGRLETTRWFLWGTFLSFPTGFVAVLSGWYTAEVGRQPWVVYGLLRTKDAVTPSLTTGDVLVSLAGYVLVYAVLGGFGTYYIYKLLREGPAAAAEAIPNATASRPLAYADTAATATGARSDDGVNAMEPSTLALFWAGVIAARHPRLRGPRWLRSSASASCSERPGTRRKRRQMMASIAPFWDGNETWLVVIGASLFAAFPAVYAVFLGAFYLPVLLMLLGLIFRGVAFEFRYRSAGMRRFWDGGFFFGSLVVAFVQGAAVGAMMRGIPVENGQFAGDTLVWLHPFPVLTGIGLVLGYALLGAGWLAFKTEGALRDWAHARIPWLVAGVLVLLGLAFAVSLTIDAGAIAQGNLGQRRWGLVFPIVSLAALVGVLAGARARRDAVPLRDDGPVLSGGLRHARRDDVALHDPLCADRGRRRRARCLAALLLLRWDRGAAGDRRLYHRRLLGVSRQDRAR